MISFLDSLLNRIAATSESYVGIGLSAAFLAVIIALLRVKEMRGNSACANIGDVAAVGLTLIQSLTYFTSVARPNTVHYLGPYVIALSLYIAIRLLSRWPVITAKLICRALVGLGSLLFVANLPLQLSSIRLATKTFSPSALGSIRAALPFVGSSTKNDLVAVLLSILPFALAGAVAPRRPNRYFWIVGTVVVAGLSAVLVLSLSRSGYLALGLLLISLVIQMAKRKGISVIRSSLVLICICAVAYTAVAYVHAESAILAMARGDSTMSQSRSAAGRLVIWRESAREAAEDPIVGHGGGTSGIVALKRLSHSDLPFAARSYNGPLEILTLSGVGGLGSYAIFLFYPLLVVSDQRRENYVMRSYPVLLAFGLIALMVHDLTYPSMVTNGATIVVAWIMVASLQNVISNAKNVGVGTHRRISLIHLAYLALGVSCVVFALSLRLEQAEKYYGAGSVSLANGDISNARTEFQRAIELEPKQSMFYAADGLAAVEEAMGTSLPPNLWSNVPAPTAASDLLLASAERDYNESISLVNNDASYWTDLAWIEIFRGRDELAAKTFAHAIQVDPNDVMSRIGAGLLYERRKSKYEVIQQYAHAIAVSPRILDSKFFEDLRTRSPDLAKVIVERSNDLIRNSPLTPIHLAGMARLDAFLGAEELAHREYMRALSLLPNLSYASANLGVLDLQRGDRTLAHTEFERARFLDGTNRLATNMLALIDQENGNLNSAKRLYRRTLLVADSSVHSQRSWRLYHVFTPTPDDLVPQGLLSYLLPEIRPLSICDESWLAELRASKVGTPDVNRRRLSQDRFCSASRRTSMQGP